MPDRKFDPHGEFGARYIKIGPFYDGNETLPGLGTSPYLDWFLQTCYVHRNNWIG